MKFLGALARSIAMVGMLVAGAAYATPVTAAPGDVALLKSYIGDWRGRGTLTGKNTELVVCRLSLTQGNGDKVNYSGRCVVAGNNLALKGTLAYIADKSRFEAAMTSNARFSGIAVGQERNGSIVFDLHERDREDGPNGKDVTVTAQIALDSGKINVRFQVEYVESGEKIRANIPFTQ
ncbi:hypothetical protein PSQ90_16245 [Devosia rhodophyticola]|uniref:THAP4-like heme-binding beta-barrel domain-containing protein n=1 Tax=Devosia rhodophyticola TaxID=3026423 RepID=A0ABY7YXF7_9HYPH|nr:hypothetical protein [Devosia rhodophyticola]WDR05773.1 hypothetical protein PSQ90_16245 [Devosia rhodophyticola]